LAGALQILQMAVISTLAPEKAEGKAIPLTGREGP
jgi:hypothetical protein